MPEFGFKVHGDLFDKEEFFEAEDMDDAIAKARAHGLQDWHDYAVAGVIFGCDANAEAMVAAYHADVMQEIAQERN